MPKVLALSGSPSANSHTTIILAAIGNKLVNRYGVEFARIAARDLPPAALVHADTADHSIAATIDAVKAADGIVIGTPIYQAAYSGLLKALLDLLPKRALAGKVVLPIATAGSIAHLLAIDYALRPVLAALGAENIRPGRLLLKESILVGPGGHTVLDRAAQASLDAAAADFSAALTNSGVLS